jgi:hypothetical protein
MLDNADMTYHHWLLASHSTYQNYPVYEIDEVLHPENHSLFNMSQLSNERESVVQLLFSVHSLFDRSDCAANCYHQRCAIFPNHLSLSDRQQTMPKRRRV